MIHWLLTIFNQDYFVILYLIQIVHKSLVEEVVRRLVSAYKQVKIGDPLVKGNLCGPLHTMSAVESYQSAIAEAQQLVSLI